MFLNTKVTLTLYFVFTFDQILKNQHDWFAFWSLLSDDWLRFAFDVKKRYLENKNQYLSVDLIIFAHYSY